MTQLPPVSVPRPASTLLLVQDGDEGIEVLMVKRSQHSSFMGGVYVFPGGGVDPSDADPMVLKRIRGRSEVEAAARLGAEGNSLSYWVSAVRELFEESGILLTIRHDGQRCEFSDSDLERLASYREELNGRRLTFPEFLEQEDLYLDAAGIHHHAHWVTPTTAGKRFDTYFFVARGPNGQVPAHDEGETVAVEWITPAEALSRHRHGHIEMVLPTIRNLRFIEEFDTVDALLSGAAALGDIPSILPRMVNTEDGPTLLVPGDPGYEDLPGAPDDPKKFPVAAQRRAVTENPPGD